MSKPTTDAETDRATRLRHGMVDAWGTYGITVPDRVAQAMRTVPRHMFLPGHPLEMAYDERSVVTHRDDDDVAISSASGPSTVARMLADLDVQPGSRILEIGAATGYNAALLAYLTGPTGHVTTIEILPEAAEAARRHLATAGFGDVRVVCGDGMLGDPDGAPYDRIIATAGVWDIPPAWMEQAASDARMVMPLRISGYSCRVALHRDDRAEGPTWRSDVVALDGFIPMRGIDERPERNIALAADGAAELRVEGVPADPDALAQAAGQTPVKRWSGATINGWDHTSLAIWLAALGGTGWVFGRKPGHSLADLTDKSVRLAVLDHGDTFGYLAYRPAPGSDGDEIGVYTYGPHGEHLADLVVDRLRTWSNQHATLTTWVEIYPVGIPIPATDTILLQVDKQYVSVIVRTASSVTGC